MRVNLLHPPEFRGTVDPERRSGRTTAVILRAVADALASPGTDIPIVDHWPYMTVSSTTEMVRNVSMIVQSIGLAYYTIKQDGLHASIRFDIFKDVP